MHLYENQLKTEYLQKNNAQVTVTCALFSVEVSLKKVVQDLVKLPVQAESFSASRYFRVK